MQNVCCKACVPSCKATTVAVDVTSEQSMCMRSSLRCVPSQCEMVIGAIGLPWRRESAGRTRHRDGIGASLRTRPPGSTSDCFLARCLEHVSDWCTHPIQLKRQGVRITSSRGYSTRRKRQWCGNSTRIRRRFTSDDARGGKGLGF